MLRMVHDNGTVVRKPRIMTRVHGLGGRSISIITITLRAHPQALFIVRLIATIGSPQ